MAESRAPRRRSRVMRAARVAPRLGVALALAALAAASGDAFLGGTDKARIGLAVTWADVVSVESDRPQIVGAERVEGVGASDLHAARIVARERGEARVTFRVQPLDESGRPTRDAPIEDSMMIEVRR